MNITLQESKITPRIWHTREYFNYIFVSGFDALVPHLKNVTDEGLHVYSTAVVIWCKDL